MKSRDDLNLVLKVNMENAPIFFVLQETGLFLKGEILKVKDVRFMTPEEISSASSIKVVCMEDPSEQDYIQAQLMLEVIQKNNKLGKPSMFIIPVGPIGYMEKFAALVNEFRVSLKNVTIINMDEYMITAKELISPDHPMSFRYITKTNLYDKIDDELNVLPENRLFPDPEDPLYLWERIQAKEGGVDICFGGIGMDGHIAFNEPPLEPMSPEDFAELHTRVLPIYYSTRITNAISEGGNFRNMPGFCVSIGMKEIMSSQKLVFFNAWPTAANAMKRIVAGPVTSDYPGSIMQWHKDCTIYTTKEVLNTTLVI